LIDQALDCLQAANRPLGNLIVEALLTAVE
jgi:hypothetical protein